MNVDLLNKAADMIEEQSLGHFSMLTNTYDISAYIISAAGHKVPDETSGPFFGQARKLADLPGDKLLWTGGWPEWSKEALREIWAEKGEGPLDVGAIATVAAYVVRAYAEEPWD